MAAKKKTSPKKSSAKAKKLSAKTLSLRKAQVFIELMGGADKARKAIDAVEAAENAAKKKATAKTVTVKNVTVELSAADHGRILNKMFTESQASNHAAMFERIGFDDTGRP